MRPSDFIYRPHRPGLAERTLKPSSTKNWNILLVSTVMSPLVFASKIRWHKQWNGIFISMKCSFILILTQDYPFSFPKKLLSFCEYMIFLLAPVKNVFKLLERLSQSYNYSPGLQIFRTIRVHVVIKRSFGLTPEKNTF